MKRVGLGAVGPLLKRLSDKLGTGGLQLWIVKAPTRAGLGRAKPGPPLARAVFLNANKRGLELLKCVGRRFHAVAHRLSRAFPISGWMILVMKGSERVPSRRTFWCQAPGRRRIRGRSQTLGSLSNTLASLRWRALKSSNLTEPSVRQ